MSIRELLLPKHGHITSSRIGNQNWTQCDKNDRIRAFHLISTSGLQRLTLLYLRRIRSRLHARGWTDTDIYGDIRHPHGHQKFDQIFYKPASLSEKGAYLSALRLSLRHMDLTEILKCGRMLFPSSSLFCRFAGSNASRD